MRKIIFLIIIFNLCTHVLFHLQAHENNGRKINLLEEIIIGNTKQWILIRGEDTENPILLFLHGGPGFPQIPFTHIDSHRLEKHFIVVNWDQRGAGKSFNEAIPKETMNIEQFLSDTHELIQLLKTRFSKDKLFLIGHSWGSILGMYTAFRYPNDLYTFIGMGQVVNIKKSELISYHYTLEKAKETNDSDAIEILTKIGSPPYDGGYQSLSAQRNLLAKYGGSFRKISYQDLGRYWSTSPYYSEIDKSNLMRAFVYTQNIMWDTLMKINLATDIQNLQIPVYFFTGRYDYQTAFELLEEYFKVLEAPYKEIIWFENSGHVPNLDEPEVYQNKLINVVLKNTFKK
jgi:pimeloyl-ACP methyl ester carboxylesterase